MTLREFTKQALSKQEVARFGPKGMGRSKGVACKASDISDGAKSVTGRCASIFALKKGPRRKKRTLGEYPASVNPPSSSAELPGKDMEASPTGK